MARLLVALLTGLLLAGSAQASPPGAAWQSAHHRDHPLVGRIWQPSEQAFVTPEELKAALLRSRFALLGEHHNNLDHHRLQAWLLERLIAAGRKPAVAFEMFTSDQEEALKKHLAAHPKDAAGIGPAVDWAASGWPDWSGYQPIAVAALAGGAPLLAASWPRGALMGIARDGIETLGKDVAARLQLDRPRPDGVLERMRLEIFESHCGQLPESMIDPMMTVTTLKDARMAAVLVEGAEGPGRDSAVLIAGNGHVRGDDGVPWHLSAMAPGEEVITIGLFEAQPDRVTPPDYAEPYGTTELPFDFVWFTPRADDRDPCEVYAESLKKARKRHLEQQEAQ